MSLCLQAVPTLSASILPRLQPLILTGHGERAPIPRGLPGCHMLAPCCWQGMGSLAGARAQQCLLPEGFGHGETQMWGKADGKPLSASR